MSGTSSPTWLLAASRRLVVLNGVAASVLSPDVER